MFQELTIGEVCKVGDGAHASIKRASSGIPYLTSKNFKSGRITMENVTYISSADYDKYFREDSKALTKILPGDVALSIIGTMGEPYLVKEGDAFGISSSVAFLRPDLDLVDPLYLYYWMKGHYFQKSIYSIKGGVAQGYLSLDMIRSLPFRKFDITTQKRIGRVLSIFDRLIDVYTVRIQLMEKICEALYSKWFQKLDFSGGVGNIRNSDYKLPDGWRLVGMSENRFFELISKNVKNFDGTRTYYATADIKGADFVKSGKIVDSSNRPSRATKIPELNSVWFARMKNSFKIIGVTGANAELVSECIISSGFVGYRVNNPLYFPFLYLTIASDHFQSEKDNFCTGSTQESITNRALKLVPSIEPEESVVKEFSSITMPLLKQCTYLRKSIAILRKTRDCFLSELTNGDLDVNLIHSEVLV